MPSLFVEALQRGHTLLCPFFYRNLATQPHLVSREAENVVPWPRGKHDLSVPRN